MLLRNQSRHTPPAESDTMDPQPPTAGTDWEKPESKSGASHRAVTTQAVPVPMSMSPARVMPAPRSEAY